MGWVSSDILARNTMLKKLRHDGEGQAILRTGESSLVIG